MPPQQAYGLLDVVYKRGNFGSHELLIPFFTVGSENRAELSQQAIGAKAPFELLHSTRLVEATRPGNDRPVGFR